ncbi:hypothetical protein K1T73_11175 [Roseovarius sp. SCSIO 43702]|uniref:hypothetical protein n=1 Tax=Roseovarius sp. SCSIO 43702 TaxID=2823043 RepID=UPI001C72B7CA|nr:hypothetical protein [Roseovarius sp. SCSIO 43702]QYX55649.1 hypothetical protein K1T73_11175 [Roseovarius sp. SCSIO 43702]
MRQIVLLSSFVMLGGCAQLGLPMPGGQAEPAPEPASAPATEAAGAGAAPAAIGATGNTAEALDTTSAAERAEAASASGGAQLGRTIVSLGDVAEPGFWIKTPLADAPGKGRVENPATGQSAQVDLIPLDGPDTAGSRISLSAMRLIGAELTDLPEVIVYSE